MKFLKSFAFRFCRNQDNSVDKYFTDIKRLRKTLEREHFFVRKHHKQFGLEIERCILNREWEILRQGLRCINIGELDSWLTLRKIANTFTEVINSLTIKRMKPRQLQSLLYCLNDLNYQPVPQSNQNDKDKQNNYVYDNISPFTDELRNYIFDLSFNKGKDHYLQLIKNLLHTNPQLFIHIKGQLQNYLLDNLEELNLKSRYFLTEIISRGTIANFWTAEFKNQMIQRVNQNKQLDHIIQSFYLQNLVYPNQITQSNMKNKVRTQEQIINILQGYGYNIKFNMEINKYEVDVLINDFLIVEYNGHHHYVINSDQLVPTLKHQWKTGQLIKRGFVLSSISYPEWKEIHLFEQKRKFLVNKIQTDLLKFYSL